MVLKLYDTMAREKRVFEPAQPGRVTLYVCGPTVYNYAHIGNARPVVVFDVLFRLLRRLYGADAVIYARNVTDVDDKIVDAASAQGVGIEAVTSRYLAAYEADMAALNALPPTRQPRATAHIPAMVDQIGRLVRAGAAYESAGHVLFAVSAFPDYGALSHRSVGDMLAGARVEVADYKRSPADFVLWKPSKPGEPEWPSPWGPGRPGWHIECSAMIEQVLGLPIDIHGGGHDLIFPHHENEIAQGRCATGGGGYAGYWMHNGFLTLDAEKMSKSLGNVRTVHGLLDRWPGEVLRWALLSAHYRAPLDWTDALLEQSRNELDGYYNALQRAKATQEPLDEPFEGGAGIEVQLRSGVLESLCDDLNTPWARAQLSSLLGALNLELAGWDGSRGRRQTIAVYRQALLDMGHLFGVLAHDPDTWFTGGADGDLKAKVGTLIAARTAARNAKDWTAADRIRAELAALNVEVLDGPDGAVSWRMKG